MMKIYVCINLTIEPAVQFWSQPWFNDVVWHIAVLEDLPDAHDDEWNTPSVNGGIQKLFAPDECVSRQWDGTWIKKE
jgi:hypothetical protein